METEDEIGQTFDQAIRAVITTGSQSVRDSAQGQQTDRNGDTPSAGSGPRIDPQALHSEAGAALAASSRGFPTAAPAELNTWHPGRSPHAPKRTRAHGATNERGADRDVER